MAEASDKPRPFDVRTIRHLVRMMRQHDLSEIDLTEGDQRIRLRRGNRVVSTGHATPPPLPAPTPAPAPAPAAEKPAAKSKLLEIKISMAGLSVALQPSTWALTPSASKPPCAFPS